MFPEDVRYTAEHEWVRGPESGGGDTVRIGITDYAQEQLGDIVYVSLPAVGDQVEEGSAVGELESTKSVSDVYAPLTGEVTAVNEALEHGPVHPPSGNRADDLGAAEHRHRAELHGQPVGIGFEIGVIEADDFARYRRAFRHGLGKLMSALARESCVGAVEKHRANSCIRREEELGGLMCLDGNHGARRP